MEEEKTVGTLAPIQRSLPVQRHTTFPNKVEPIYYSFLTSVCPKMSYFNLNRGIRNI